jgi:hypothetical protein
MGRQRVRFPMTPQLRKFFQAIGETGGNKTAKEDEPRGASGAGQEGGRGAVEEPEEGLAALRVPLRVLPASLYKATLGSRSGDQEFQVGTRSES